MSFCAQFGVSNPFPVSQPLLCYFVVHLANSGLAYQTIKTYLAAIRHEQIAKGLPEPKQLSSMPKLKVVENGVHKKRAVDKPSHPRLPITPAILRQIRALWAPKSQDFNYIMLWAVACTCFFGFFRLGELLVPTGQRFDSQQHLSILDLAVDNPVNPTVLQLYLKRSKTDQFHKGTNVYIGRTGDDLCPVAALMAYLAVRGMKQGPLFQTKDGQPVSREFVVDNVRQALQALGLESTHYAGHSFRIGAATTAAERGIPDSTIKVLGRWKSEAFQTYIRLPQQWLASISQQLSTVTC